MLKRVLAIVLSVVIIFTFCPIMMIVNAAEIVVTENVELSSENNLVVDGGFETAAYDNSSDPIKSIIPTFTAIDSNGNSTKRFARKAQIISDIGFSIEGKQCIYMTPDEDITIALPNLYEYKGGKLVLSYYVRAKTATMNYGTWGKLVDRSIKIPDENDATKFTYEDVYDFKDGINYWTQPEGTSFDKVWTKLTEKIVIPDTITEKNEYVLNFGCFGNSLYYDAISCVLLDESGNEVNLSPAPAQTPVILPVVTPPTITGDSLYSKTVAFDGATWTAREVPENTIVTLLPDYSEDKTAATSNIKGGGFESTTGWSDVLERLMFWQDGGGETNPAWKPWTFSTDVKIEGNQSGCVDVSSAMAELSGQTPARLPFMSFTEVIVEPCFDNQVYHLRFYVKADRELGFENPQIMVYLLDADAAETGVNDVEKVIGTKNIMLDAWNIDYHWYDQNEIDFEEGQNPKGKYKQGYGPFYQGKWIQIDSYFVTPEDFNEDAYNIQIHTNSAADCKLYFDAFSLEKITMDEVDLGVRLVDSSANDELQIDETEGLPTSTFAPTPTAQPSASATASVSPSATASATAQPSATTSATARPSASATASATVAPSAAPIVVPSKKSAVKKSIKFTKKSVKIKKGKKVTLKVKITGAKNATFSVDKKGKKVVKISKKKAKSVVVTGKKKGKAVITAKAASKTATCRVTVK